MLGKARNSQVRHTMPRPPMYCRSYDLSRVYYVHSSKFQVSQQAIRPSITLAMSDLQRSFAKAKIAGLPSDPPIPPKQAHEEEEEDELDDLKPLPDPAQDDDSSSASSASSASSTGTIRPSPSKHLFARPKGFVISF